MEPLPTINIGFLIECAVQISASARMGSRTSTSRRRREVISVIYNKTALEPGNFRGNCAELMNGTALVSEWSYLNWITRGEDGETYFLDDIKRKCFLAIDGINRYERIIIL